MIKKKTCKILGFMENIACKIPSRGSKTISIPWPKRTLLGPDIVSVVGPTGVKLLDFFILQYSVVNTVESLFLFHLLFIYRFVFTRI